MIPSKMPMKPGKGKKPMPPMKPGKKPPMPPGKKLGY